MFTHIMVGSNNFEKSKAFYDAALGALGVPAGHAHNGRAFIRTMAVTLAWVLRQMAMLQHMPMAAR
jgi:catechol 2,3-dioxygenase-like lactoylglutathione lyase family enzyme